jgi:hypothetical protein
MARVHREEGRPWAVGAHGEGVVGGDAGRPQLLQEERLEVDQMEEGAGDVHHRLAGADPLALAIAQVDLDRGAARAPVSAASRAPAAAPNTTGRRMKIA